MPYELPDSFPHGLSDRELGDSLTSILAAVRTRYGNEVGAWLPELQLALVTVAISDQSRRQLVTGSRIAIGSLLVAAIALVVAIVTLVVS